MRSATMWMALVLAAFGAVPAAAQNVHAVAPGKRIYAVNRVSGQLAYYDFTAAAGATVGYVRHAGVTLTGIDAAVYFPRFTNLYAIWTSPADGRHKLVYININSAEARVVADDLEGGRFTGAATAPIANKPYGVFVIQQAKIKPPATISGSVNINPNNNDDNQFQLITDDGTVFTRDHLHQESPVNGSGTFYEGGATFVHVKPKGNGNQNGLIIDGETVTLQNSNTYDFSGTMQVRVYNDHIHNSRAMGHWWIQIISGAVIVNNDVQVLSPNRLALLDQTTGVVTELMPLEREYQCLATPDGITFYTTHDNDLYMIDTATQTETYIGQLPLDDPSGLSFIDGSLVAYDAENGELCTVQEDSASRVGNAVNPGLGEAGVVVFAPAGQSIHELAYD